MESEIRRMLFVGRCWKGATGGISMRVVMEFLVGCEGCGGVGGGRGEERGVF